MQRQAFSCRARIARGFGCTLDTRKVKIYRNEILPETTYTYKDDNGCSLHTSLLER